MAVSIIIEQQQLGKQRRGVFKRELLVQRVEPKLVVVQFGGEHNDDNNAVESIISHKPS